MPEKQAFTGSVRSGRGAGAVIMSEPVVLDTYRLLAGLPVIPGTLNLKMSRPFDLSLLGYIDLAAHGFKIDLAEWGIDYAGELGMYSGRVLVEGEYPAGLIFFSWADPGIGAELVSPHHLRTSLGLRDGDTVGFTLVERDSGAGA